MQPFELSLSNGGRITFHQADTRGFLLYITESLAISYEARFQSQPAGGLLLQNTVVRRGIKFRTNLDPSESQAILNEIIFYLRAHGYKAQIADSGSTAPPAQSTSLRYPPPGP